MGEHLKYLMLAGERPVACLAWSSAPRQLDLRDQFKELWVYPLGRHFRHPERHTVSRAENGSRRNW
jgi:hypothetical protein